MESVCPTFPQLFATDIERNVVELKNVILNEFHVLCKFCLISLSDEAIRVSLDSDLRSQIGFQLNNENIDNADEGDSTAPTVATFLADDFCEVFNTVNLVNYVVLQPRQVQQVILAFRPVQPHTELPEPSKEFETQQDVQLLSEQKLSLESTLKSVYSSSNQTFPVIGNLFLSATVIKQYVQYPLNGAVDVDTTSGYRQDIVVHFYSTVCWTILKADVPDIVFDDCVPGGVFVKDFSVWNLSEIPCAFQLHVKSVQAEHQALDLTDYDTGLPVASGEIKSCAHRRIRVTFKPRDVGDFTYSINLENSFDARNSTSIPVQCLVNTEHRQEGLLVTGVGEDGILDFGDCYSNNGTCQMLSLRNITQEALVVNLGTDHSPGDQVNFYLQSELDLPSKSTILRPREIYRVDSVPEEDQRAILYLQKSSNTTGVNATLDKKNRIEELSLERGEEKNLLIWFHPISALDEAKAARLHRRTFRLSLKCAERKGRSKQRFSNIIQCKARICTSIVKLSTPELNFGDCNIGSFKSATVEIINLSDLPALVTSYVTSTVLSFKSKAEQVLIPPRQAYSLDIDLVPLKINPKYRKQITIDNFYNKENQQVLEVRAKIMDRHHVLLHSLYYKLHTPSTNNFLNFDCVIVNNPNIRILAVENITDKYLMLGFNTSMPEELGVYQLRDESLSDLGEDTCSLYSDGSEEDCHENRRRAYAASINREKLLETLEESQPPLSKAIVDSAPFPVQQGHKKSMPPRPPYSASERKTRMRMSLDLATIPFTKNGGDKLSGRTSISGATDVENDLKKISLNVVKPFNSTEEVIARPLKRVQSSALLSAVEEDQNLISESSLEEVSHECIEEVLKRLGNLTISHSSFPDEEAEKKFVDNQIKDREILMHVLENLSRTLSPIRKLELPAGETKVLYVLLTVNGQTRPSLQGRLQKLSAKISIQLLEFDKEQQEPLDPEFLEPGLDEDLFTRELPVQFKVCRAVLSLAQKNISFGKLLTNEHRAKTLVLNNVSDVPLLYKLKKTGSIASGDLHIINGRTGILRPHCDREVNFVFQPSLGGSFRETLVVSNVYDPSNDQVVTLKATISRADTFWLNVSSMDFGTVSMDEWSRPQSLILVNNSKQSRTFMMKAAEGIHDERATSPILDSLSPVVKFMLEEKRKALQRHVLPEEEVIEALERKGLAYERKGKLDKAAKVRKQVDELRVKASLPKLDENSELAPTCARLDKSHTSQQIDSLSTPLLDHDQNGSKGPTSISKGSNGFISFSVKGGDSQVVLVNIMVSSYPTAPMGHRIKGAFIVYESKNQDVVKKVYFEANTYQTSSLEEVPVVLGSDPLKSTLHTVSSAVSCSPVIALSPNLSPDSSSATSPSAANTPQSVAVQHSFRPSSPYIDSSHSPFEGFTLPSSLCPPSTRHLASEFSHVLETDAWGSENHILQWGEVVAIDNGFDPPGVDEDSSYGASQPESCSSVFALEPVFKIDLLNQLSVKAILPKGSEVDPLMDLSSAAALARSLGFDEIQQAGKPIFAGEITMEDSPDTEKMEALFALRCLCSHDLWIQLHLAWDGEPDVIELWVSNDGRGCQRRTDDSVETSAGLISGEHVLEVPASWQFKQVFWQRLEPSGDNNVSRSVYLSSVFLSGGMTKIIKLMCPEEGYQQVHISHLPSVTLENVGVSSAIDENMPVMGVLTMQAQPDDGIVQQLLVRVKPLEKLLRVLPTHIVFPESDLTMVLTRDLIIKNRSGSPVNFLFDISGATYSPMISSAKKENVLDQMSTNSSNESLNSLYSPDNVVCVSPGFGQIKGRGTISVKVSCQPVKPGKQMYTLRIHSPSCLESEVNLTLLPCRSHCLVLPDLPDGGVLDMGFCFMNALCPEKVVPLRLQNVSQGGLSLSFRSNLAKQVYVSLSPKGLSRLDDLQLAGGALSTIFMCLRPGGDATALDSGQCREIIGGMRITARAIGEGVGEGAGTIQEKIMDEIMVKFQAVAGKSLLQVSTSMIDLGRVKELGGFVSGDFFVFNSSSQMPLHFLLSAKQAVLSVMDGHLVGKEAAKLSGVVGRSELNVKFSLPVRKFGLIEDKIVVHNLSCPGQNAELILRLFVDNGIIESEAEQSQPHFYNEGIAFSPPISGVMSHSDAGNIGFTSGWKLTQPRHIMQALPPLSLEASSGGADSYPRKIRKVLSAGDFHLMNVASSLVTDDNVSDGKSEMGTDVQKDMLCLGSSSSLDLGTVFISPVVSTNTITEEDGYFVSDSRPFQSSFLLVNHSQEAVELWPFSNLPVIVDQDNKVLASVQAGISDGSSVDVEGLEQLCHAEIVTKISPCGGPVVLQPKCKTHLYVSCVKTRTLSLSEVAHLNDGKLSPVEGLLVFFKCDSRSDSDRLVIDSKWIPQAVDIMNIKGSICVSIGKVAKQYVDLGKVGYANRWADVEFDLTVDNCSDAQLIYQLEDVPDCFKISVDNLQLATDTNGTRGHVAPRSTNNLRVSLCTSKLEHAQEAGLCSWHIRLLNCNNPHNMMELVVEAEMTVRTLRFEGLTESSLLLPPLTLPSLPTSAPCMTQFVVENLSVESLGVALQLHQAEETESLVMLEIHSQTNNTITELTLGPGEKAELRVCARPISDTVPARYVQRPSQISPQASKGDIGGMESAKSTQSESVEFPGADYRTLQSDESEHKPSGFNSGGPIKIFMGASQHGSTVCFGQLFFFSSPYLPDCIPIHGAFLQGSAFDVSPHTLYLQARVAEDDELVESCTRVNSSWEGRHDSAGASQILVVRNFRAFDCLRFEVLVRQSDLFILAELPFDVLTVQPLEGMIAPHGSAEILVKVRPWSSSELQSFHKIFVGTELDPEPIAITLNVEDTEDQNSYLSTQRISTQRIMVRIRPPEFTLDSPLKDGQPQPDTFSNCTLFEETLGKEVSRLSKNFKRGLPTLGLRGCTPVSGSHLCYEFNLGQQNISSGGRLNWDMTLVGDQHMSVHYLLCTISDNDASWLSISSCIGLVEASQQKIVQLSFSTKSIGVYSTYLMVENRENPADLKTVHLSMEVVAPRNARPEAPSLTFFHVLVQGDRTEGTVIDMGEVYYNFWYRNRSFVIVNEAPVAMEFLLSSSMDHDDSTELNFSLANTSLKRFSSVTLGSKNSVRIWIHFCPGPSREKSITEDTCDEMSASILVNCRLVKDYQQCIPFLAKCRYPQIGISTTDVVFSTRRQGQISASSWAQEEPSTINVESSFHGGPVNAPLIESVAMVGSAGVSQPASVGFASSDPASVPLPVAPMGKLRRDDDIELLPPFQVLIIRNLYLHRKLQYIVKNDSLFFETEAPGSQTIPSATVSSNLLVSENKHLPTSASDSNQSFHMIVIKPNVDSLRTYQKMVLKQKYIEEHLTIYNRSNPREKYTVSLRITAGHLQNFFAAPGRKNSYPFNRLELSITSFLSSFYSFTSAMLAGLPVTFQTAPLVDLGKSKDGGLGPGAVVKQEMLSSDNKGMFRALEKCLDSFSSSGAVSKDYDSLFFDFHYLTDELVFYCLKERWSRGGASLELATVQLSKLLYCALYRCQIFQLCLGSCYYFSLQTAPLHISDHKYENGEVETRKHTHIESGSSENFVKLFGCEFDKEAVGVLPPPKYCLKFVEDWTGQLRHFLSFFPDSHHDLIPLRELNQSIQDTLASCQSAFSCTCRLL